MIRNLKRIPVPLLILGGLFVCALLFGRFPRLQQTGQPSMATRLPSTIQANWKTNRFLTPRRTGSPLKFTLGEKNIIPGMSQAIRGMKVGESKTVTIASKDAYGPYNDKLVFEVPTKNLPPGVKAGMPLRDPQGNMVLVKEVKGDKSVLDANHILAGKDLIFDIKLVSIN